MYKRQHTHTHTHTHNVVEIILSYYVMGNHTIDSLAHCLEILRAKINHNSYERISTVAPQICFQRGNHTFKLNVAPSGDDDNKEN